MSSSAPGGSGGGAEEKGQGFSKFMRRASKVLKRGSSSKGSLPTLAAASPSSPRPAVMAASKPAPSSSANPPAVPANLPASRTPAHPSVPAALQQSIRDTKPSFKGTSPRFAKTAAASNALQEEKARAVFMKYGFTLEPGEWTSPTRGDAERVEKIVRIRVRRTCHRCGVTFGADRVCVSCQHTRCKKCPKYPSKMSTELRMTGAPTAPVIVVDENYAGTQPAAIAPLNMLHRPAGKNLARPDSTPRARRFCRRCNTRLNGRTTQCANCHHLNSPPTPREPPDVSTHPEGSADDGEETVPIARREFKPIRMHVRWTCHACHTVFKDLERECRGCGHRRCDDCPREPPKEEEEPLDEAAVRKIADLMRNVNISPHASAA